jgi:hypothetical protein
MITAGTAAGVFEGGAPPARARLAVVMLHGRGSTQMRLSRDGRLHAERHASCSTA